MDTAETAMLLRLYLRQPLSVDHLPYSLSIQEMVLLMTLHWGDHWTEARVYRTLMALRKQGLLPTRRRGVTQ